MVVQTARVGSPAQINHLAREARIIGYLRWGRIRLVPTIRRGGQIGLPQNDIPVGSDQSAATPRRGELLVNRIPVGTSRRLLAWQQV